MKGLAMKRLFAVVAALTLWCAGAWAGGSAVGWSPSGPGGGGNFRCVDVTANGRVAIGSDVSGIYVRSGTSGDWSRKGAEDGLIASSIFQVKFSKGNPSIVVAGTGNGCFWSTNTGDSWAATGNTSSVFGADPNGNNVSAIAWGQDPAAADSATIVAVWGDDSDLDNLKISTGTLTYPDGVPSLAWTNAATVAIDPESTSHAVRVPIKVYINPLTTGSGRDIYLLTGNNDLPVNGKSPTRKELWVSRDGGSTWERIAPHGTDDGGKDAPMNVVDFGFRWESLGTVHGVVTTSSRPTVSFNSKGFAWYYKPGATQSADKWWKIGVPGTGDSTMTGAVFYLHSAAGSLSAGWHVINVQRDACSGGQRATVADAGMWRRTGDGSLCEATCPCGSNPEQPACITDSTFYRIDSGFYWETGYSTCDGAMGQTIANAANSISALGDYWVTAQNVWRYKGTTWWTGGGDSYRRYVAEHTKNLGYPWRTTHIDNANCTALFQDPSSGNVWAGFYDIGLWERSGSAGQWTDRNSTATAWGQDGEGGNVTSIIKVGSTMYVVGGPSSKSNYYYKIWKSINGGTTWDSLSIQPPHDTVGGAPTDTSTRYLRSLAYDSSTSTMFVSCNGAIWKSVSEDTWVSTGDADLPKDHMMTVSASGGTIYAGGLTGIYKSTDGGVNWTTNQYDLGFVWSSPTPGSCPASEDDIRKHPHKEQFHGVHDIWKAPTTGDWFFGVYVKESGACANDANAKYGLVRYNGSSWTNPYKRRLARSVASDSSDLRVFLTSSEGFSSGSNRADPYTTAEGVELLRTPTSGSPYLGTIQPAVKYTAIASAFPNPDYRYAVGSRVIVLPTTGGCSSLLVSAQGYGPMMGGLPCSAGGGCEEPCEVELGGGGGDMRAKRPRPESEPAEPRTHFSVSEAPLIFEVGEGRTASLYDVSGRQVRSPKPGVYFLVERTTAGAFISRRTVVVTR